MPCREVLSVGTDESVVISGISGRFPQTDNMRDFARNLYEKRDLVDDRELRWAHVMPDVPRRTGKVNNLEKFDGEFFGIDRRQRDTMDPQLRMLIEHAYEAILDAGVNPETIRGSRTGVFCGACFSETEVRMYYKSCPPKGLGLCNKSQLANRVSYTLDLKGPSFVMDTACSSSMYALDVAYRSIMNGECDAAIVSGTNLTLHPFITYQFALLGVLAKDGFCRPFDKDATGYSRSEAVCAVFLQKAKVANRIYGYVIHSKTNCDGFKPEGITYPSKVVQQQLLQEFYDEVDISPTEVDYVEAHSTGTFVGDPEECEALDKVYCNGRKTPLPVGSVKSSIGHSEAAAGVCSIAKCIIAMENGLIPPNINFREMKPTIPSLVEGRLKVVDEIMPLNGPLVGINSFGFGGANAHTLLCRNLKEKKNHGLPEDDIPRLVIWAGRTKEAVEVMFQDIAQRPLDVDFLALLYNIQKEPITGFGHRGYAVYQKNGSQPAIMKESCIGRLPLEAAPLVLILGGVNPKWREELDALREFSQVDAIFVQCSGILRTLKFELLKKPSGKESVLYNVVGTTVLQLALVELLHSIGVQFNYYGGHSVGQFTCAYIDGNLNLEQTLKLAFWHGLVYSESKTVIDANAVVKLNSKLQLVWKNVSVDASSTFGMINGSQQVVAEQLRQMADAGFMTEELPFWTLQCDSSKEATLANSLRQTINSVLSRIILPTQKWLTAKLPNVSSIFHSPKLHQPVSVMSLLEKLPKHSNILQLGGADFSSKLIKILNIKCNSVSKGIESLNHVETLLSKIGQLSITQPGLQVSKLYPAVQFPVARGTTMIAPLIRWDHRESAFVCKYTWDETEKSGILNYKINLNDRDYKYIVGHCIDGRVLFPATGYLYLVWDLLCYLSHREMMDYSIEFEDVKFLRATTIAKGQSVTLLVMIQDVSGYFEILEGDTAVVTGYARTFNPTHKETIEEKTSTATVMKTKDFYKELRLRGYHYTGLFKSVLEARADGTHAKIQWKGNWVAFLDCLLQIGIIAVDTRSLMVPTAIGKISISPKAHLAMMEQEGEDIEFLTMRGNPDTNVSVCGGIVISNPRASIVGRRNPPGVPVLETYGFVPYFSDDKVSSLEAVRMCVQLALENAPTLAINVTEVYTQSRAVLAHLFGEAVADLPLVRSSLTVLTPALLEIENVTVKNEKLAEQSSTLFLITENKLADPQFIEDAKKCLTDSGFILLRESIGFKLENLKSVDDFHVLSKFTLEDEILILLQRKVKSLNEVPDIIAVDTTDLSWLAELKQAVKLKPVILYAQNDSLSGIIGLVNCIRKEPKLQNVRCVFIDDPRAPKFALKDPMYKEQLNRGLAINVYKNGAWGSYRHALLRFPTVTSPVKNHCYANCATRGDLSSMAWFSGALNENPNVDNVVKVSYSSLNFRDVMIATGRLTSDIMTQCRLEEECELGFEYAGITASGKRIMGMRKSGCLATMVEGDPSLMWDIPDEWSLEEACTVPVVYLTVYMSFFKCANIRKGQSVLIHAGSGGVGLAAIQIALFRGLEVFTTVSTQEKKDFLLQRFPNLKEKNIGNSRSTSFEKMVMLTTNGRGVDYVLNSLAEEKLQASVRCLAKGGHFLEIGKYDMSKNSQLALTLFQKGITFTSIMLDIMFHETPEKKAAAGKLLSEGIARGEVKPLYANVFDAGDLEKAVRYLAGGKHTGKVLLKIRENETDEETLPILNIPRVYCNPNQVCVIVGGLGGFGLELADWLVIRGCRKLVLSSSRGITKPYQEHRIRIWKNYGVETHVCTADVTSEKGCRELLLEASKHGQVSAIYNLAVQLRDCILENQTVETFSECLAPKALATKHLDAVSRKLCPKLSQFVVFSSVSCGRGNAGQSNYGMANSIMERIMEKRSAEGLPAKAIQWGAVGEVGLVADMAEDKIDMEIGGTLQQRISSCIQEMDRLMSCDAPIVASMVVAEKRAGGASKNIIEAVMNIMSIKDLKTVSMESTLADIGMDSLMAVEIKQVLERDFDLVLSPQDLRTLSFAKLLKLDEDRKKAETDRQQAEEEGFEIGMQMLLRNLGDEEHSDQTIMKLPTASEQGCPVLLIPGLEGVAGKVYGTMVEAINAPVYILQLMATLECDDVPSIVDLVIEDVCSKVFSGLKEYIIVAYSFGSLVAVEITKRLQAKGMRGKLLLLDGAPKFLKNLCFKQFRGSTADEEIQKILMFVITTIVFPNQPADKVLQIMGAPSFDEQIEKLIELSKDQAQYSAEYTRRMTKALFRRLRMAAVLNLDEDQPLDLPIMLVRPSSISSSDIEEDYGLSNYTTGEISLRVVEGSHTSMLDNPALVDIINNFLL
ncbi:hypothetical protein quinque_011033 [Culex quinquefasciatus]